MKYIIFATFLLLGCGTDSTPNTNVIQNNDNNISQGASIIDNNISNTSRAAIRADIIDVKVTGTSGNYMFLVSVKSDDTGCEQYANWWEVLNANKELIYRRILGHPHVGEDNQPVVRYAEHNLDVQSDDILYIRAHMNNKGYVGDVFKGSVKNGFIIDKTEPTFDTSIEHLAPQANECP